MFTFLSSPLILLQNEIYYLCACDKYSNDYELQIDNFESVVNRKKTSLIVTRLLLPYKYEAVGCGVDLLLVHHAPMVSPSSRDYVCGEVEFTYGAVVACFKC